MLHNYFKMAFRNLVQEKWYSLLNIGGLGLVLAVSLMLFWWVKDELQYDRFHSDTNRIYRVNTRFGAATTENTFPDTPAPIAVVARKSIPGVEAVVRISLFRSKIFRVGNNAFTENGDLAVVDENFLDIFTGFTVLYGDRKNPFPTPTSVVLTEGMANKFFGFSDVIGKTFKSVEDKQVFVVGAVIADSPDNSSLKYKMYIPMQFKKQSYSGNVESGAMDENWGWGNYDFETFIKLGTGVNPQVIGEKITSIKNSTRKKEEDTSSYFLQTFEDLHLYTPDGQNSGMQQVNMLGLIAFLILSIGCINYVNLTTARATRRNKEVGIRKAVGAKSGQLAGQLLVESLLTLTIALVVAVLLIRILSPFYENITGKTEHFSLTDMQGWFVLMGATILTFLLAGVYPAILIAGFNPVNALRGRSTQYSGSGLRKGLVVAQFTLTTVLICSTLIIGSQLRYVRERDPGFNRELTFSFDGKKFSNLLKQDLANEPAIKAVSTSSDTPVNVMTAIGSVEWDGKDPKTMIIFAYMSVDPDFIPNFGIKLIAGQNFNGSCSDSVHFVLNETAVHQCGIRDPIGKRIKCEGREGTIIGVVKDFNIASVHETIRPLVLYSLPESNNVVLVKTDNASATSAIAIAGKLWKKYAPEYPFEYKFLDEDFNAQYEAEQRTEYLFNFFAATAVIISCLGLLGLVSYTAEQRTKEIGIRKVLGATVANITSLLSKDFLKLVLFGIGISMPVSWYFMNRWLENFAFKIQIDWKVFVIAAILTTLTALLTISFQSIKAALTNPVKSLKSE